MKILTLLILLFVLAFGQNTNKIIFVFDNKNYNFQKLKLNEQELMEIIKEYINKDNISLDDLQNIINISSYFFQKHGYIATTVYVPQQNLDETIQINITLGMLGEYIIKNSSSLSTQTIKNKLDIKNDKGKIITTDLVENAAYKINETKGTKVEAALQSGKNIGETDVILEVSPGNSSAALFYTDNYGIKEAGTYRSGIDFKFYNTFHQGDQIDTSLQSSNEKQINYNFSYNTFIGNWAIFTSLAQNNYSLGGIYKKANFIGTAKSFNIESSYPLWLTSNHSFYIDFGYIHKILSDSRLSIITINKESNTLYTGFNGTIKNPNYNNIFSYSLNWYIGNVKDQGTEILGQVNKTGGEGFGKFSKINLDLNNYFFFSEKLMHSSSIRVQKVIGGKTLDSSETSSLGGIYGVRAYDSGIAEADNSIIGNFGIRYETSLKNLYITPFYDIGYSWYENKSKAYRNAQKHFIDALGLEILYNKENNYYVKISLSSALHQYKKSDTKDQKIYISLGKFFIN